ncbi:hypothetical protein WG915_07175 [Corynebacterium sp. H128]|uniref:hypothetical protein n=1 Tax=unclassified Corynebacterium TaxID=2624378 RepID=UPI0030A1446F
MLRVIPGLSHLKLLDPTVSQPPPRSVSAPCPDKSQKALTQVALEVAYGIRPPAMLHRNRFDPQVRIHIAAFHKTSTLRGPVHLLRVEAHAAPLPHATDELAVQILAATDLIGTCRVAKTTQAFAARLELPEGKRQWVMRSLRLT